MKMLGVVASGLLLVSACTLDVPLGSPTAAAPQDVMETEVLPSEACLAASPFRVDLGLVHENEVGEGLVRVTNACDDAIVLTGFTLSGDPGFVVAVDQGSWTASPVTAIDGVTFESPWFVPPRGEVTATVRFTPVGAQEAHAVLVWRSDVFTAGTGLVIKLVANESLPCLASQPKNVDFGGKVLNEVAKRQVVVSSCGTGALEIAQIILAPEPDQDVQVSPFALVTPVDGLPWKLEPGEEAALEIAYTPVVEGVIDETGAYARDRAALVLLSNTFEGSRTMAVHGFGVLEPCPEAVITGAGDEEVAPAAHLTFDGSESWAPDAPINHYTWTRVRPDGKEEPLADGPEASSLEIEFSSVGEHVVRLVVKDENGTSSCAPAEVSVVVQPAAGLHLELTWTTAGDPNPYDEGWEMGSDLDLHLLHPLAVGADIDGDGTLDGWFDDPLDAFWNNLNPDWGQVGDPKAADDPELLRDDIDTLGPEVLILEAPEADAAYRIGVHGWAEHGFGPSVATVRVWVGGDLVHASGGVELHEGDLWDIGLVHPTLGTFTATGSEDGPHVTSGVVQGVLAKP